MNKFYTNLKQDSTTYVDDQSLTGEQGKIIF